MLKKFSLVQVIVFCILQAVSGQVGLIQNVYQRMAISLNGEWNYIIDPYEMGYFDYRMKPYDENPKPQDRAFFTNTKPKDKTERIEYDFDRSPVINVPGD
jgi:beta-glucuronidase